MHPSAILAPGDTIPALLSKDALPADAHAGLVFDRYLPLWEGPPESPQRRQLLQPLKDFADAFGRQADEPLHAGLLAEANRRLDRALGMAAADSRGTPGTRCRRVDYVTQGPLATGLGNPHPSDNGFVFDPVLGLPVLAGSGVKGLARAAADLAGLSRERTEALFGPERIETEEQAAPGDLVFLNAWPAAWPRLAVDVVNCHHPSYYRGLETAGPRPAGPSETDSPIPVFFLTVAADSRFAFRLGSRAGSQANLDEGLRLLDLGLTVLGMGAKTAVGYGLMAARTT
jgi:CRISPR-associated protein Cmr6